MEGSEIWISFRRIWISFRRTLILFRLVLISFRRILNSFHCALVENWIVQQRNAMQGGIEGLSFIGLGHCVAPYVSVGGFPVARAYP